MIFEVACFTGHRPGPKSSIGGYDPTNPMRIKCREQLSLAIKYAYNMFQTRTFITGMALGVDQDAAELLIDMRDKEKMQVKIVGAIPCYGQEKAWPSASKKKYRDILNQLDEHHFVTQDVYTHECMQIRNEWMVDRSQLVIAVWDGTSGGTGNCVNYAKKKEKSILRLHPKNNWQCTFERRP